MKGLNKKRFLLGVRVLLYMAISLTIFIAGYIYIVVDELKLKLEETQISQNAYQQEKSILEKDTSVYREDLDVFLLFSQEGKAQDYITDQREKKSLNLFSNKVEVLEDIKLPHLLSNSCQRYRCIQIRKKFTEIPSNIWKALLGTEDFRFLEHKGVDPIAIARALIVDIIAMKFVQGGSTLTQQLVKNLFLTNEKKLSRKIKEMIYALYIENILSKEEIITLYLNEVFWGTYQGIYLKGFYAASLAYFNKAPQFLNEFEATVLVSLLKGPNFYRPRGRGLERLETRANAVFKRLQNLDLFTQNDQIIWSKARWMQFSENYVQRAEQQAFYAYYLVSKNSELSLEAFEKLVLFKAVERRNLALASRVGDADIGIKILIAHPGCEGFDCKDSFSFYSKTQREKRQAITKEYHQIGSLFKPIVYDTYIDLGRSYDEEISTAPIELKLKSGIWRPKDYSRAKQDKIQLKAALQKSKNIPLIRIANEIGFDALEEKLIKRIPRLKTPLGEYPAQLLGALELSLEEVFVTYKNFIEDKCKEIESGAAKFEETILYYMSVASETTISRLASGPLRNAYIFGKTGTSNHGLDNWYFAFDGKQYYVFWYGVESSRDQQKLRVSGASTSFLIFQDFINHRGKLVSEVWCEGLGI